MYKLRLAADILKRQHHFSLTTLKEHYNFERLPASLATCVTGCASQDLQRHELNDAAVLAAESA